MALTATRTLRGALAGAAAAARVGRAAAARQARLRRRLRRRRAARPLVVPAGGALAGRRRSRMHLANGALFGAVYANVAPSLPVPAGAARAARRRWPSTSRPGPGPPCRPRPPGARGAAAALGHRPRVRAGDVAPPAVRRRARRARAAAEPAGRRAGAGRRRRRLDATATAPPSTWSRPARPALSRRVLITGASGFAGAPPAAACAAAGDEVVVRARRGRRRRGRPARRRRDARARRRAAPDVVYHLAARAHVGRSWGDPGASLRTTSRSRSTCSRPCGARRPTRWSSPSAPARSTARRRRCR